MAAGLSGQVITAAKTNFQIYFFDVGGKKLVHLQWFVFFYAQAGQKFFKQDTFGLVNGAAFAAAEKFRLVGDGKGIRKHVAVFPLSLVFPKKNVRRLSACGRSVRKRPSGYKPAGEAVNVLLYPGGLSQDFP